MENVFESYPNRTYEKVNGVGNYGVVKAGYERADEAYAIAYS
jgi:hypothetical protein